MLSFFALAFLIGMTHAFEADHIAALSTVASRQTNAKSIIRIGAVWGIGHTLTLLLFAGSVLVLGFTISDPLTKGLEMGVAVMLMVLGGNILYRLWRDRIHFHVHSHAHAKPHFHAHQHTREDAKVHVAAPHEHDHPPFPFRSLWVGMMHGMAGSAALLLLTASHSPSILMAIIYVLIFGLGSILGMVALSVVIAVPLAWSAKALTWANQSLQLLAGGGTLALGSFTIYQGYL